MPTPWEHDLGRVGASAPSWLTFQVHRPYFDGAVSPYTAIQARGPALAARLFGRRDLARPRFAMVMPASYRLLLTEESRLAQYRVSRPTDLPAGLASTSWARMADAFARRAELDGTDRAGLALWLVAACLPDAVLDLIPADLDPAGDDAFAQYARATALSQREGLSAATAAAFAPLVADPQPTVAHLQALAGWAHHLARHATDDDEAPGYQARAREICGKLAGAMPPFHAAVWQARLDLREVMYAERHGAIEGAWHLLGSAWDALAAAEPDGEDDGDVALELRRRLIDRRVELAVRRQDLAAEEAALAEGLALDPYCVKIQTQAAQAAQRRGDDQAALAGYLRAARLGPFGTGYALLNAAETARRLGRTEVATAVTERAFRAAPRSDRVRQALLACYAGDPAGEPLAAMITGNGQNWHYLLYRPFFNLGQAGSPAGYARLPLISYEFAVAGQSPRLGPQRTLPPAFRRNLIRESGLAEYGVSHPADLPAALRTPAWDRLCGWLAGFADSDARRRLLTVRVLSRLGFGALAVAMVPDRPASGLQTPEEFCLYRWRDVARQAGPGAAAGPAMDSFALVDHPGCPLHLKLAIATHGVVFAARQARSLPDAQRWRDRAAGYLAEVLDRADFTGFEKALLESRFYRGAGFVPFLRRDLEGVLADMGRAEELARAVPAATPWEELLKAENLRDCLESRAKEAFGLGDIALGHQRTCEFLALDPYDPRSHIELAESLVRQQRHREAADSYLRAARLGPVATAVACAMAGECFARAGDDALAEDCYLQALRVDPYAVSAARGWRRVAAGDRLAVRFAADLEEWGASRGRRPAGGP